MFLLFNITKVIYVFVRCFLCEKSLFGYFTNHEDWFQPLPTQQHVISDSLSCANVRPWNPLRERRNDFKGCKNGWNPRKSTTIPLKRSIE